MSVTDRRFDDYHAHARTPFRSYLPCRSFVLQRALCPEWPASPEPPYRSHVHYSWRAGGHMLLRLVYRKTKLRNGYSILSRILKKLTPLRYHFQLMKNFETLAERGGIITVDCCFVIRQRLGFGQPWYCRSCHVCWRGISRWTTLSLGYPHTCLIRNLLLRFPTRKLTRSKPFNKVRQFTWMMISVLTFDSINAAIDYIAKTPEGRFYLYIPRMLLTRDV